MGLEFRPLELEGLLLAEGPTFPDGRGFFREGYREAETRAAGIPAFVQDNLSRSTRGALRGLHYQRRPNGQGKLVRCVRGRIFDVAVDIRRGSPTYGRWAGVELSDEKNQSLWVPEGFAHGFYTLSDVADVLYKVTAYYAPQDDRGIIYDDPDLGILWPAGEVVLSPKDSRHPRLKDADNNF